MCSSWASLEVSAASSASPGERPLLSAYEMDACANALADALRASKLVTLADGPVRLGVPEWRNEAGVEVGDADVLVRALCTRVNECTGAAVAFDLGPAPGPGPWDVRGVSRLPTRLSLEKSKGKRRAVLVLEVTDPTGGTRFVEIRHRIRLPRRTSPTEEHEEEPGGAGGEGGPEERGVAERAVAGEAPAGQKRRSAPADQPQERPGPSPREKIRQCRLSHFRAMPEDEDVEREGELSCGRLLFLDRKAADRLVRVSDTCRRLPDGTLSVELELACRKKKRKIEIWAELFDAEGRGVNRTRTHEERFREGQIRSLTFNSVVPAEQVVVIIEKD